jgi:hypothetical protein
MEQQIVEGNIGTVGSYDVDLKDGVLIVEVSAEVPVGQAGLVVKLDACKVLDVIAAKIPGSVADAIFGVIKAALKM